jgi:hypothetical protein
MAGQALVQQLANGPEGGTLHSLTKYAVLSALKNPLLKAIMLAEDVVDMLAQVVQRKSVPSRYLNQHAKSNKIPGRRSIMS